MCQTYVICLQGVEWFWGLTWDFAGVLGKEFCKWLKARALLVWTNSRFLPHSTSLRVRNDNRKGNGKDKGNSLRGCLIGRRQERQILLLGWGGCADDGCWWRGGLLSDGVVLGWGEERGIGVALMEFYYFCGGPASTGIVEDCHHVEIKL